MVKGFKVGARGIGPGYPPFVIAEMSGNHGQSLRKALEIVDAAAASGAHALKLQTYTADTMTLDLNRGPFRITDPKNLWHGYSLYKLYRRAHTPWEWHKEIFRRARRKGMLAFSTPFDATAVDFLEELGVPLYKIASFENTDLPLVKRVAATGKPVIISTGMATEAEIRETVAAARKAGCRKLVLLKCTSNYPADPASSNLLTMPDMAAKFGALVGISDHTLGIGASVAAVALGACVIEKHFTLRRAEKAVDADFSLEPAELASLVRESRTAWQARGGIAYGPSADDRGGLQFRRSLYVARDMARGEKFTPENLRSIRPSGGLPPKHYERLLGRRAARAIKMGTPASWSLVAGKAGPRS